MLNKYIIADKPIFMSSTASEYIKAKYKEKPILTSWYFCNTNDNSKLHAPIYFEIKKDLMGVSDYVNLQGEVIKVLEYIKNVKRVSEKYIRIYFNGDNGFYIILPSIITDIDERNNVNLVIKNIASKIKEESGSEYMRLDIYDINSTHYMFNTKNKKTELYLVSISEDMIKEFSYKQLISFAGKPSSESYFEEMAIPLRYVDQSVYEIDSEQNALDIWKDKTKKRFGIWDEAVTNFKEKCESNEVYKEQYKRFQLSYKDVFLASSKYPMEERKYFVKVMMLEMIKTFLINIYGEQKHVSFRWYGEEPDYDRNCALCSDYVKSIDPLIHINIHTIGNNEFAIELDDFFKNISLDYLSKVIATLDHVIGQMYI